MRERAGRTAKTNAAPPSPATARVIIDARMVGPAPDGISRYVTLLARGLAAIRSGSPEGLPYEPVFLIRAGFAPEAGHPFRGFATREVRAPFLDPRELIEMPLAIGGLRAERRQAATVYHSPSFCALLRCPVPWLVTVHDLNHLEFGGPLRRMYYRAVLRPFLRRAAVRMTVSQCSRRAIARWAGVSEDSVEIVSNAIHPVFAAAPPAAERERTLAGLGLEAGRYFLCLANPKPHKNVGLLVEAYRAHVADRMRRGDAAWPLVLNVAGYEDVPGVRRLPPLPETALRDVMASAAAFFFPSRYEGFGLPPLEAAVAGTPVVVSRIPALQETLGSFSAGEACWIDPVDVRGWTGAFARAAAGTLARPDPASRARALARFSVERLGTTMDRIYRRALGL
jgi:alpha-1,3-rhamnosyl/mannosyltransferase